MRLTPLRLALLFGAALFLLGPTTALTQPGGGKKGKKGFDPSADGGGAPGGKKGFGRPDGSGGPGGGLGNGGPGGFDPTQMADRMFDRYANGGNVLIIADLQSPRDPQLKDKVLAWAQSQGITNGQLTRAQYADYFQTQMGQFQQGGGMRPGGSPGAGNNQPRDTDKEAEDRFRKADTDGDGFLSVEEMKGSLRDEWQKWDKNGDGQIDLAEYKEYYKARMAFLRDGQDPNNRDPRNRDNPNNPQGDPIVEDDKRPTVYKVGHLPKELPPWFAQMDTDKDGQVGLYEWKNAGADLHVFVEIDTNSDGLLTVEEVLRWQKAQALAKKRTPGASAVGEDEEDPDGAPKVTPKIQTIYGLNGPDGQGGPGGFNRGPGGQGGPGGFNRGPGGQGGPGGFNRGPGGQGGPGRGTGDANDSNANPFGRTRGQGKQSQ